MSTAESPKSKVNNNSYNKNKLYIGNIPHSTNEVSLSCLFSKYGPVKEVRLMRDRQYKTSRGFGFITFESNEAAERALNDKDIVLEGRKLKVNGTFNKNENEKEGDKNYTPNNYKLYIGGLSYNVDDVMFKNFFEQFGEIKDSKVMRVNATNQSRGFGFVTFKNPSDAEKVLLKNTIEIDGRASEIKLSIPRDLMDLINQQKRYIIDTFGEITPQDRKIFVKGMDIKSEDENLKRFFQRFGKVSDVVIIKNKNFASNKTFGFVTFDSIDSTIHAINSSDLVFEGNNLTVSHAEPKKDNSSSYNNDYEQSQPIDYNNGNSYPYENSYDPYSNYQERGDYSNKRDLDSGMNEYGRSNKYQRNRYYDSSTR